MIFTLKNRLFLKDVPDELKERLFDALRFKNPKWLENERLGRWNKGVPEVLSFCFEGKDKTLILPRGYIRKLIDLCREMDVPFELVDRRRTLPPVQFSFTGELKPFQQEAVDTILPKEFGVLCAPTGSGKTVMALDTVAARKQPALVVVHTKALADQWIERIEDFMGIPAEEVGLVGSGKFVIGERITVALIQTLYKRAEKVAPSVGYLIVDECHRIPSRTFTEAVSAFDSKYMLGLSATPWRRDKLSKLIYWHMGTFTHEVEADALREEGHILQAEVIFRKTDFVPYHDPVREYSKMLSELIADDGRNRLIASDVAAAAAENEGAILILSDRKKHCEILQALINFKYKLGAKLLTGEIPQARRREVIEALNSGEVRIVIATGQLIGEGFDCKNLSMLFIATPIRFGGRVIQYLGRILRPSPGKSHPKVYDYVDVRVGPLTAAARSRWRTYGKTKSLRSLA